VGARGGAGANLEEEEGVRTGAATGGLLRPEVRRPRVEPEAEEGVRPRPVWPCWDMSLAMEANGTDRERLSKEHYWEGEGGAAAREREENIPVETCR
jgi:hypothetical protein